MKALATLLVLSVTPLAAKPVSKSDVPAAVRADREELGGLRRELASALLVKKLDLSRKQKDELLSVIADAKALRAKTVSDKEVDAMRDQRKDLLRKAIDEARRTGEISAETKVGLEELRGDGQDLRKAHAPEMKALKDRVAKILTDEQIAKIQAGRKQHKHQKQGKKKGMMLRLLMSDEFEAELKR